MLILIFVQMEQRLADIIVEFSIFITKIAIKTPTIEKIVGVFYRQFISLLFQIGLCLPSKADKRNHQVNLQILRCRFPQDRKHNRILCIPIFPWYFSFLLQVCFHCSTYFYIVMTFCQYQVGFVFGLISFRYLLLLDIHYLFLLLASRQVLKFPMLRYMLRYFSIRHVF